MAKRHPKPGTPKIVDAETGESSPVGTEEDSEPEISNVEKYLEEHKSKLLVLLLVGVGAIAVLFWFSYSGGKEQELASLEFTSAEKAADYNLVVERHGGTVAAGNALMMRAKLEWAEGKKADSLATWKKFLDEYPEHPLRSQGEYGAAIAEDALGNRDEATKLLKEIVNKYGKSENASDATLAGYAQIYLGDMALRNGDASAKDLYAAAIEMSPGLTMQLAEARIDTLNAEVPVEAIEAPPLPKEEPEPDPTTPDPDPTTPNPDPTTPDPDPTTPDPDPTTPNPDPTTPDPDPTTPNPDPTTPDPDPTTPNPDPATPDPDPTMPNPDPTTPDPDPTTPNPDPATPDPDPTTPNPDPATPDPIPSVPEPGPAIPEPDTTAPDSASSTPSPVPSVLEVDPAAPEPGTPSPEPDTPAPEPDSDSSSS